MGKEQIEQAEIILNCEHYGKKITLQRNEVLCSLSLRCIKIISNRKIL